MGFGESFVRICQITIFYKHRNIFLVRYSRFSLPAHMLTHSAPLFLSLFLLYTLVCFFLFYPRLSLSLMGYIMIIIAIICQHVMLSDLCMYIRIFMYKENIVRRIFVYTDCWSAKKPHLNNTCWFRETRSKSNVRICRCDSIHNGDSYQNCYKLMEAQLPSNADIRSPDAIQDNVMIDFNQVRNSIKLSTSFEWYWLDKQRKTKINMTINMGSISIWDKITSDWCSPNVGRENRYQCYFEWFIKIYCDSMFCSLFIRPEIHY